MTISGGLGPYDYLWSNGSTTENIEQVCGGYYYLTVTDQNNCEFITQEISVYQPPPTISGEIYLGPNLMSDGIAILCSEYIQGKYLAIDYLVVDSGSYSFTINPFDKFVVYALPNPNYDFNFYPIYFPTYYGNSLKWEQSEKVVTDYNITNADIHLNSYDSLFYGYGSVSGTVNFVYQDDYEIPIYYNNWFDTITSKYEYNNPAKNIPLILFQTDGTPVSYILSGNDGGFSFKNIEYGEYYLHAEKAGFRTHQKYLIIDEETPVIEDIDVLILTGDIFLSISSNSIINNLISIYPNPTSRILHINTPNSCSLKNMIMIYNSSGILLEKTYAIDNKVDVSHLTNGMYFLKMDINSKVFLTKFVKIE